MFSVLLDTARLRSGYTLTDSLTFAQRVERMVRESVGVAADAPVEEEPEPEPEEEVAEEDDNTEETEAEDTEAAQEEEETSHEEL